MTNRCKYILARKALLLFSFILLQSCAQSNLTNSQQSLSITDIDFSGDFGERSAVLSPDDIHYLSSAQKQHFLDYMNDPKNAKHKEHWRLYLYLKQITENFNYQGETLVAADAFDSQSGNCMSLAILTSALAKIVNLEIAYQLIDDIPVYEFNDKIIKKGVHVRSIVYDPEWHPTKNVFILSRPGIQIDYFPTNRQRLIANLDENEYLSRYYLNISTEALINNDFNRAYWHAIESFKFSPDNSTAINMLAIINKRTGNIEKAEQLYLYGIERADEKLSLLKNYRILLTASGRLEEANRIEQQLESLKDPSPFNWYQLARSAYDEEDFIRAIRYYNKAISLAPYLHEAHLGLAQSNFEIGKYSNAKSALKSALDNVRKTSTRSLYQAKLLTLNAEIYH